MISRKLASDKMGIFVTKGQRLRVPTIGGTVYEGNESGGYGGNPCCISLLRKQIQKQRGINLDQRQFLNRQRRNPRELCACGDSIGEHAEHSSHYCLRRGCGCSRFSTPFEQTMRASLYRKQGEKGTTSPGRGATSS